jgi:hypothetical protein
MKGIVKLVRPKYIFILIPDDRQIFAHSSTWMSIDPPCVDDVVEFDIAPSIKPQYKDQAMRVRKISCDANRSAIDVLATAVAVAEVR